jgi:hypothetical protein
MQGKLGTEEETQVSDNQGTGRGFYTKKTANKRGTDRGEVKDRSRKAAQHKCRDRHICKVARRHLETSMNNGESGHRVPQALMEGGRTL